MTKQAAAIDVWAKAIAPLNDLRKWYGHDPDKHDEFRERYLDELDTNRDAVEELIGAWKQSRKKMMTLLTSTKEMELSHAEVLDTRLNPHRD